MYQSVLTLLQQHLCVSSPTTPTSPAPGSLASAFATCTSPCGGRSPSPSSGGELSRNPSPVSLIASGAGAKLGPPTPTGGLASPLGGPQCSQQLYSKLLLTLPSLYALEREQLRRLFCVALEADVDVLLAKALTELAAPSSPLS